MNLPREFWLDIEKGHIYFSKVNGTVHVIEFAAYEQLKKENESLKEEIQGWMRKVSQKEHSIVDWENYVAREKNENYKLKSKLKLAVEFIKCISVDVTKREMILKEIES